MKTPAGIIHAFLGQIARMVREVTAGQALIQVIFLVLAKLTGSLTAVFIAGIVSGPGVSEIFQTDIAQKKSRQKWGRNIK